eukprot:3978460-Karenia_brevis.AAC.1
MRPRWQPKHRRGVKRPRSPDTQLPCEPASEEQARDTQDSMQASSSRSSTIAARRLAASRRHEKQQQLACQSQVSRWLKERAPDVPSLQPSAASRLAAIRGR